MLNERKDSYLKLWELDLTTKEVKNKFNSLINHNKQKAIEKEIKIKIISPILKHHKATDIRLTCGVSDS